MMQTLALLLDAYREMKSRRLFWLTLILSGLVVAIFALLGIDEEGVNLCGWQLPLPITSEELPPDVFYKTIFANFGIGFWLTWAATILALVSTASIFPDFVSSGSIDLLLAKPISRLRLFLTKYLAGLLFVALQVAIFTGASFLVIGLRGGVWEPGLFLAVPLTVLFFSYLFCVLATLGVMTRSTIASLLLTVIFWFVIFLMHSTESGILAFKLMEEQKIDGYSREVGYWEGIAADELEAEDSRARAKERAAETRETLEESRETQAKIQTFHDGSMLVKSLFPKTTETVALLERWLIDISDLPQPQKDEDPVRPGDGFRPDQAALQRAAVEEIQGRSPWWIIGTSLAFEAVILAIGAWIFCRRDF